MTQQIEELEAARHSVRKAVFALGLNEGLSIGELGRLMGFSRRARSTYAKEARGDKSRVLSARLVNFLWQCGVQANLSVGGPLDDYRLA